MDETQFLNLFFDLCNTIYNKINIIHFLTKEYGISQIDNELFMINDFYKIQGNSSSKIKNAAKLNIQDPQLK